MTVGLAAWTLLAFALGAGNAFLWLRTRSMARDAARWRYVRKFDFIELTLGEVVHLGSESRESGPANDRCVDELLGPKWPRC